MELKRFGSDSKGVSEKTFNRTFMELKPGSLIVYFLHYKLLIVPLWN